MGLRNLAKSHFPVLAAVTANRIMTFPNPVNNLSNIETCRNQTLAVHRSAAVASRAIELALRRKQFTVKDIQRGLSDPPSRQTIYRVLETLQEEDWVENDGKNWEPSIKAQLLSDVDVEKESTTSAFDSMI